MYQTLRSLRDKGIKAFFLASDMESAFENASRKFICDLLRLLGVCDEFISMLGCLWSGMKGVINYDGIQQEEFTMLGGLSQGAPESALLFNLIFKSPSMQL